MKLVVFFILTLLGMQNFLESTSWQSAFLEKIRQNERPAWMCTQISQDFAPFYRNGISRAKLKLLLRSCPEVLVHYKISNGKLFVTPSGAHVRQDLDKAIHELLELVDLPDVEFLLCCCDSASERSQLLSGRAPFFAYAMDIASKGKGCILIPDYDALSGKYAAILESVNDAVKTFPWKDKIPKAIWRGGDTGYVNGNQINNYNYFNSTRFKLIDLSFKYPSYIDARFHAIAWSGAQERFKELGCKGDYISIFDHIKYKYQILADGFSCAYSRAYWQLFSNSLIFKQASPEIQWYYNELKPDVHYIEVYNDYSDLIQKIEFAMNHDEFAQKIVANANEFAKSHLKQEDIMLYLYLVILEYSKLQNF